MANEFKVKKGLIVDGSGSVVLDVRGSHGQLFSVTDSLSGSLFGISDISGIPIFEVFSDDTIKMGTHGAEAITISGSTATISNGILSGSFSGSFVGDASGLTGLSTGAVTAINNATANELVTVGSTTTELDAEANLTFNGTLLDVTGNIASSGTGSFEKLNIGATQGTYLLNVGGYTRAGGVDLLNGVVYTNAARITSIEDKVNNTYSSISFAGATRSITFMTSGSNRMVINSDGDVNVLGGALSISGDGSNAATFTESGNGDFTIATVDDLRLDAGGNDIVLRGASSAEFARLSNDSQDFVIKNITEDKDIVFKGNDGNGSSGVNITALTLDMSDGGSALFGHNIGLPSGGELDFNAGDVKFVHSSNKLTLNGGELMVNSALGVNTTSVNSTNKLEVHGQARIDGKMMIGDSNVNNAVNAAVQLQIKNSGQAGIRLEDSDNSNLAFDLIVDEGVGFLIKETVGGDAGDDIRLTIAETTGDATFSGTIGSGAITSTGKITGTELEGTSLDINGNADISGALTVSGINEKVGNAIYLRNYELDTGNSGGNFLIGQIEDSGGSNGAISATVHFAYDYGSTTNNCTLHFNFAQRSGTARGTWWYEADDQEGAGDRVHARVIDDGSGNMYVWITCVDYSRVYVEARHRFSSNFPSTGTLTSATLTTGTTLFDTADNPTAEMHVGNLFAHGEVEATSLDINGNGNLSGTLTIPGGFATTILDGDNVVVKKPNYSSGGWARALMNFKEHDNTTLYAIGAYGSNNTFTYGYIGTAYNDTTMRWAADKTVTFGGNVTAGSNSLTAGALDINGNADISGTLTLGTALAVAEGGTGATASTLWLNSNAFSNFASTTADYDTVTTRGLYRFKGATNGPFNTSHTTGLTLTENSGDYGWQMASNGSANNAEGLAYRYRGTSWGPWQTLVTKTFGDGRYATLASGSLAGTAVQPNTSPTFDDLTVTGNLVITGTVDTYNVNNLNVVDKLIILGAGQSEANSGGSGIFVSGSSASILWDETNNTWDFNKSLDIIGNLTTSGNITGGGLTLNGSLSRGTYVATSNYHTGSDNIVLKGNSVGISGIFFESEKDGTNINHSTDFGFIQYHAYGTGTSGENAELIVGVSNDSSDHVILNAPHAEGFRVRVGASETDYKIFHEGHKPVYSEISGPVPTWNQDTTGTADNATSASHALTADTATTAGSATSANTATSASHALIADTATTAGSATSANTANTATSASHALIADTATSATTATTAGSAAKLTDGGGLTTQPGQNNLIHTGQINAGVTGLFATSDNSNSIITLNRHSGNYDSQLGFSSNGYLYYRKFSNSTAFTTQAWKILAFTDSDITGEAATVASIGNLTGHITSVNRVTSLGSFTLAQLNTAISDNDVLPINGGTLTGNLEIPEYLYHAGDTNTYLRFRGDDLQLVAGGRNIMRMDEGTDPDKIQLGDSSTITYTEGSVGIGIETPTEKLHVAGGGSGNIRLDSGGTYYGTNVQAISSAGLKVGNDNFSGYAFFDNNGNVGIGTDTPDYTLDVKGDISLVGGGENYAVMSPINQGMQIAVGDPADTATPLVTFKGQNQRVGIGTDTPATKLHVSGTTDLVTIEGSGSVLFDVQGSQGQLFSITDSLEGTLFSVSDVAGIPILEVDSSDKVTMGSFGANTLVVTGSYTLFGTSSPNTSFASTVQVHERALLLDHTDHTQPILIIGGGAAAGVTGSLSFYTSNTTGQHEMIIESGHSSGEVRFTNNRLILDGKLNIGNVAGTTTDTDKFLVLDGAVVKYVSGSQLLSQIGGIGASGATLDSVTDNGSITSNDLGTGALSVSGSITLQTSGQEKIISAGDEMHLLAGGPGGSGLHLNDATGEVKTDGDFAVGTIGTINHNFHVSGNANITSTLLVTGSANFKSNVDINGYIDVVQNSVFNNDLEVGGDLDTQRLYADDQITVGVDNGVDGKLHIKQNDSLVNSGIIVNQQGAGDARLAFQKGSGTFAMGIDGTDGKFKIAGSNLSAGTPSLTLTSGNVIVNGDTAHVSTGETSKLSVNGRISGRIRRTPDATSNHSAVAGQQNYWTKLAKFSITDHANEIRATYTLMMEEISQAGYMRFAVELRSNSSGNTPQVADIRILEMASGADSFDARSGTGAGSAYQADSLKLVVNSNTDIQLWVQKKQQYGVAALFEDTIVYDNFFNSTDNAAVTYYNNSSWQSNEPLSAAGGNVRTRMPSMVTQHQYAFFSNTTSLRYIPNYASFTSNSLNYTSRFLIPKGATLVGVGITTQSTLLGNNKLRLYDADVVALPSLLDTQTFTVTANRQTWIQFNKQINMNGTAGNQNAIAFGIEAATSSNHYWNMVAVWNI